MINEQALKNRLQAIAKKRSYSYFFAGGALQIAPKSLK